MGVDAANKSAYNRAHYRKNRAKAQAAHGAWKLANPERYREINRAGELRRKYGISVNEYDQMLAAQGGGCAICGAVSCSGGRLSVDHDHDTEVVRGILCGRCNRGIGHYGDDPAKLRAAAAYLERPR